MSARRYGPRRPLRRELVPLALAAAVPLALAAVLPFEAISFRPAEAPESAGVCAFVTLTPAEERQSLAAARSTWQVGAENVRGLRLDMFAVPLADEDPVEVLDFATRIPVSSLTDVHFLSEPLPPSLAAPAPLPIPAAKTGSAPPAFSRAELLKLDGGR